MNYIFLNLKRFDILKEKGGVNSIAPVSGWAEFIVNNTKNGLSTHKNCVFADFFPEAHILHAVKARGAAAFPEIGCQGVFAEDTAVGGNFGAFTTSLTANAANGLGCSWALVGHSEERKKLLSLVPAGGKAEASAINAVLNAEAKRAVEAGLKVLFCIGEKKEELADREQVLSAQLEEGLRGVAKDHIVIGYEPIWAIGPGKIPPGRDEIQKTVRFIKSVCSCPVVYGGGLKKENAAMLASISEIDGGLIALTRFSGEIGFYPDEYLEIVDNYMGSRSPT